MPEAASGVASIHWWGDTLAGSSVRAAIYENDNAGGYTDLTLVTSESAPYAPGALTGQWHTVNLTTAALTAREYFLLIHDAGANGQLIEIPQAATYNTGKRDTYSNVYNSGWQTGATADLEAAALGHKYPIYLTYTPDAGSAIGDLVQSTQNSGATATLTLGAAPTSGNILIYATPNGNSGATLSTPPSGFTELTSNTAANFSFWWGWKVSDGTETARNHAWSEGNGYSLYAEYYWQQSALNPRVATNENTDNIATAGSGPQGTGSVTPDDISQNFVLAVVAAQFQPNVDGSGAWSNGFTQDVGFAATPTIASVAIASLSSAAAAVETTYSWSDSIDETYGGIAAFSLKSGADFDSGPTVSDVKGSTATITTLAS